TRYGLAASLWSENINLALDVAPKIKAGTVWINCTNVFDAAAGFGGYRESGYGREGGKEGLFEYVKPRWHLEAKDRKHEPLASPARVEQPVTTGLPPIDRTAKLYVGGKQKRPDGGYSLEVLDSSGRVLGEVGRGNRKD